jgi:hypothetical protein
MSLVPKIKMPVHCAYLDHGLTNHDHGLANNVHGLETMIYASLSWHFVNDWMKIIDRVRRDPLHTNLTKKIDEKV